MLLRNLPKLVKGLVGPKLNEVFTPPVHEDLQLLWTSVYCEAFVLSLSRPCLWEGRNSNVGLGVLLGRPGCCFVSSLSLKSKTSRSDLLWRRAHHREVLNPEWRSDNAGQRGLYVGESKMNGVGAQNFRL